MDKAQTLSDEQTNVLSEAQYLEMVTREYDEFEECSVAGNTKLANSHYKKALSLSLEAATKHKLSKKTLEYFYKLRKTSSEKEKLRIADKRPKAEITEKDAVYLLKVSGNAAIESGSFCVGDSANMLKPGEDIPDIIDRLKSDMRSGKYAVFSLGGDGFEGIELRVHERKTVITEKENRIMLLATEEYVISIPTGDLLFGDIWCATGDWTKTSARIAPGTYALRMFLLSIPDKFHKYVAVLAPTEKQPRNNITEIPDIQG